MIGQLVGHYRIVSKLGEGGMGEVYLAEDTKLDREVALKFLPTRVAGDTEALERFKREAKAAASLDHQNIVTVHEIGEHEGHVFIVMSYVRGELLSETIARKDMTIDKALQITLQVCDGLDHAHKAGIVHRDIKPDNISIDTAGRARILDFGLAKLGDVTRLTKERSTVGTLAYMSPEQSRGDNVDARTDLFSVGAIVYEMITGRRPFAGDHAAAIQYAIANEAPPPMARFSNHVTPELERIVSKLLAKDANMRYQTAADVMADVRALRSDSDSTLSASVAVPTPRTSSRRSWIWAGTAAAVVAAVMLVVLKPFGGGGSNPPQGARPIIVVLPFENLGAPTEEYFADGITDEITSRLATVTGLGVISRTSAMQYKGAKKSIAEIAADLNVTHVLEGTIRWDKSQKPELVRITPQLIRVSDDTHLWANNYERELNRIFEVQADIATQITAAMEVTLMEKERVTIEDVPTTNTAAYTYFLKGQDLTQAGMAYSTGLLGPSIEMFTRAVELDPTFARAWAQLAIAHSSYYHNGIDRTPARLELAKAAAQRALSLAPDGSDGRLAMAYYEYWGLKDYAAAIDWATKAAEIRPGDAEITELFGWVLRRQGRFDEARDHLREGLALDPKDLGVMLGIAECSMILGDLDAADKQIQRALILEPNAPVVYWYATLNARLRGDVEESRRLLESYTGDDREMMPYIRYEHYYFAREFDRAIAAIQQSSLDIASQEDHFAPNTLLTGLAHLANGDSAEARSDLTAAYDTLVTFSKERPDDHRIFAAMGLALAGLGRGEAAVANGRKSMEMYPMSKDRYGGAWRLIDMACIYSLAGYTDEALAQLDEVLSIASYVNANWVDQNPDFDPIRNDPRFAELLRKYAPTT